MIGNNGKTGGSIKRMLRMTLNGKKIEIEIDYILNVSKDGNIELVNLVRAERAKSN